MRIAPVAAASAYAHAAPEGDRSGCGAALSGLALTTRFFPGLTPWAVLFRPCGAPRCLNRSDLIPAQAEYLPDAHGDMVGGEEGAVSLTVMDFMQRIPRDQMMQLLRRAGKPASIASGKTES